MNSFFAEQLQTNLSDYFKSESTVNFTAYNKFYNFKLNSEQSISIYFYFSLFLKIPLKFLKIDLNSYSIKNIDLFSRAKQL